MEIVKQSVSLIDPLPKERVYHILAGSAKVCYQSQEISKKTDVEMVNMILDKRHLAVLEFVDIIVEVSTDRGVGNEIVRHRVASYLQESTRYANYAKERFGKSIRIIPSDTIVKDPDAFELFLDTIGKSEECYMKLISMGIPPQDARDVLPLCLKTQMRIKHNIREWLHVFQLREAPAAHPKMRQLMGVVHDAFREYLPEIFDKEYDYEI